MSAFVITQVGTANTNTVNATTTFTATLSSGFVPGDVGYVALGVGSSAGPTTPTNWTLVDSNTSSSFNWCGLYRKILVSGEADPSFASSAGSKVWGEFILRNVDNLNPEDGHTSNANISSTSTPVCDTITTTVLGDMLICVYCNRFGRTGTPPAGATEIIDNANSSLSSIQVNLETLIATGTTGSRTETLSAAGGNEVGITCGARLVVLPQSLIRLQAVNRAAVI